MRSLVRFAAVFLLLGLAMPVMAQKKDSKDSGPKYDSATEVTIKGTVDEVRQGESKDDIHLMVKDSTGALHEVCMCPQKFLDAMEVEFKKGDEVQVVGSKVKEGDKEIILAREVTRGQNSLTMRDKKGAPVWTFLMK